MKYLLVSIFLFFVATSYSQQLENVDFTHADVRLSFDLDSFKVHGLINYQFKILKDVDSVYLDAIAMNFDDVLLNGKKVTFRNDGKNLIIYSQFNAIQNYLLSFKYEAEPKKALYFVGWENEAPNQIWTQGQGKYTSNWLPSLDDTNDKIEFDLSINFNSDYEVVANGVLVDKEVNAENTIWKFDMKEPMSSYLLALVVGKYNVHKETSKSGIPLEMYYYPEDSLKMEPTYRYSKQMFDFLEDEIGMLYPWQNYKQIPVHDFLYAGMENTSATIFSDGFVVDSIGFVDKNYVNVNAHELAHQWFGDYVTAKSSEHHWLQEGFATYYALLAEKDVFGKNYYYWRLYEYAQELMDQNRSGTSTSLLNPKSSSTTFYKRGAWALHALREEVGDEAFTHAVKNYLKAHPFAIVETTDFISEVEKTSGKDLTQFVDIWLVQIGFPFEKATEILMQSAFIQEYDMVDCELMTSKCDYYLTAPISDQAKQKVISQMPNKITSKVFEGSLKTRQAIAQHVDKIPLNLKKDYESLLKDQSYLTIESALFHLWINFPEDREVYLNETKDIIGLSDKNVRQLWLALAISTPSYQPEVKMDFLNELVGYSNPKYGFEVRLMAFNYLSSLSIFNDSVLSNLVEASNHYNWRFKKYAKNMLEVLSDNPDYQEVILKLQNSN
ncbi:M1 family metallopeptidase [Xanthomarina sp. F2636L]|uniref:M1 family metallopeptidase n=1 Tax=Xanthomarina sp. F2636L TaxID=2996018 RepID=UPI00225E0B23|nr:M1 family metallopeptidase [Xanthomarina sp. F2636L]MCX7549866.1 M1 family metallopeptidase [Xanthomarina sp. F2636L]